MSNSTLRNNIKKSAIYSLIALLLNKKTNTIKVFFFRNKLDALNAEHVRLYLAKNNF